MTVEERINGRKIGILGMARSGMAVARLIRDRGGKPFVSDSADADVVATQIAALQSLNIPFETGGHTEKLLTCDYLVVSPGVPLSVDSLKKAKGKGLPVFSELEVASWVCPGRIVAITGANGKTTTTTLVGEILTAAGVDAHLCGNIGHPLADVVEHMTADSIAVVEVSSFQLETILEFKPHIAVILNLTPDHIDRHGSFEAYKSAKFRITENQGEADVFILNHDDPESMAADPASKASKLYFTVGSDQRCASFVADGWLSVHADGDVERVIQSQEIAIKGPHNLQNASAAVTIAAQLGIKPEIMAGVLSSFPGVEHRLEQVGIVAGVVFVNDSKATNVDSVRYALRSIDTPIYLILGGRDKGGRFDLLAGEGKERVKGVVAIGEAKDIVFEALGKSFPTEFADTLEQAVGRCFQQAHPGETVLLSPGCSSFDMFDNFEHRGRVFKDAVLQLRNGKNRDETVSR